MVYIYTMTNGGNEIVKNYVWLEYFEVPRWCHDIETAACSNWQMYKASLAGFV